MAVWWAPSQHTVDTIFVMCSRLDIPPKECQKAVEYYRKNRRLFQGSKPMNVAAAALHLALGVPKDALYKLGVKRESLKVTLNKLAKRSGVAT